MINARFFFLLFAAVFQSAVADVCAARDAAESMHWNAPSIGIADCKMMLLCAKMSVQQSRCAALSNDRAEGEICSGINKSDRDYAALSATTVLMKIIHR